VMSALISVCLAIALITSNRSLPATIADTREVSAS
jgi:hypothetical protein